MHLHVEWVGVLSPDTYWLRALALECQVAGSNPGWQERYMAY